MSHADKTTPSAISRLLRRRFGMIVYLMAFGCEAVLLWLCRDAGLLAAPAPGTDQLGMLDAARTLAHDGALPGAEYRYSYAYTAFLTLLSLATNHSLVVMRLLQAALCALIPVVIFRCARLMRLGFEAGALGALCWIFYAPGMLISLDFLRAAPLALVFILAFHSLLRLGLGKRRRDAFALGVLLALLILGRENFAAPVAVVFAAYAIPALRRRFGAKRTFVWALLGVLPPVTVVMIANQLRFGSFEPVPGNTANILGFYHGSAAAEPWTLMLSLLARIPSQLAAWCSSYELPNSLSVYAHRELVAFLRIFPLPYNLILGLAFVGVWFYRRNAGVRAAAALAAMYAGSMLFFTLFYRFRIPVIPLLALLAGAGVAGFVGRVRTGRWRSGGAAALLLAGFLLLSGESPDRRRPESERAAVARFLIDAGRFDAADRYFQRMHRDGLAVAPGVRLLLRSRLESGDRDGAAESFERWRTLLTDASSR